MGKAHDQRHANDVRGLSHINQFGWLRSAELGRLMWPGNPHSRTWADRMLRGWLKRNLVLLRDLPDNAGRIILLSESGARLLKKAGIGHARSGKEHGKGSGAAWRPPATWKHHLLAHGVLCHLYERGYDVIPEKEIRRLETARMTTLAGLTKIPDGLVIDPSGNVFWLEVEQARKSGPEMSRMADLISTIAEGRSKTVCGHRPSGIIVAYTFAMDERGYDLDHRTRVSSAIRRVAKVDCLVGWCLCALAGQGVASLAIQFETIAYDKPARILARLNKAGWVRRPGQEGTLMVHAEGHLCEVWQEGAEYNFQWGYSVDGGPADLVDTVSEAKLGCAVLIANSEPLIVHAVQDIAD